MAIDPALVPPGAKLLLTTWRKGGSLLLAGPPGTGKTATLVHLVAELNRRGDLTGDRFEGYRWDAPRCLFVKVRDLYTSVFERRSGPLAAARQAEVLLLDDWGAAYEHDWPLAELDGLVDHRWERQLATAVTTNLAATREQAGAASFEATAERAFSRLCGAPGPGLVVLDRRDLRR
jgi:DNA replication protein DnaC